MIRRLFLLGTVALSGLLCFAVPAAAAPEGSDPVHLEVRINGTALAGGRFGLDPRRPATISVAVRNDGDAPAEVRTVRMTGTALALTFFAYETSVVLDVAPGTTETREFELDLSDLSSQVTGLIPTTVSVLGPDRRALASSAATADVRGSVVSVYGLFGLGVLVLTLFSWTAGLWALARRRLPPNRWRRAMRFLPAGVGTGLVAVVTLSVLRLVAPAPAAEIPMVLAAAAAAFLLGYVTLPPEEPASDSDQSSESDQPQAAEAGGTAPLAPPGAEPAWAPWGHGSAPAPTAPSPFAPAAPPFPPGAAPAAEEPTTVPAAAESTTVVAAAPGDPDPETTIRLDPPEPGRLP